MIALPLPQKVVWLDPHPLEIPVSPILVFKQAFNACENYYAQNMQKAWGLMIMMMMQKWLGDLQSVLKIILGKFEFSPD